MPDWLTTANVSLTLVLLGYAWAALRWLAPRTATTIDDRAVMSISQIIAWGRAVALDIYPVIERMAQAGELGTRAQKIAQFATEVAAEWRRQHGTDVPPAAIAAAETVARGLAHGEHLADPRNAPPSA